MWKGVIYMTLHVNGAKVVTISVKMGGELLFCWLHWLQSG